MPADRYRRYLVMVALDVRNTDYSRICRVFNIDPATSTAFEKQLSRARATIGLRIRHVSMFDRCKLHPEQEPLHRAIRDHTAGIAVFEMVDELDDFGLDYQALWHSLCDAADLLMGAGVAGGQDDDEAVAATQHPVAA